MNSSHPTALIAHLERSVSLTQRILPHELPKARFALAKALRFAGREPERARERPKVRAKI